MPGFFVYKIDECVVHPFQSNSITENTPVSETHTLLYTHSQTQTERLAASTIVLRVVFQLPNGQHTQFIHKHFLQNLNFTHFLQHVKRFCKQCVISRSSSCPVNSMMSDYCWELSVNRSHHAGTPKDFG